MSCFEHYGEGLQRRVAGMRGAGSVVKAVGNLVEFGLRVDGQIGAPGQVLPQQPVGVLAGAALQGLWGSQKYTLTPVLAVSSLRRAISLPWS